MHCYYYYYYHYHHHHHHHHYYYSHRRMAVTVLPITGFIQNYIEKQKGEKEKKRKEICVTPPPNRILHTHPD